ncbi:uncharacterized protein LOC129755051 [Uranotaenia lowii]|uniref:uncharacterized protein LOC129755051 n=1 Tax=Uranotaenia lowii TaxID=190385 RepID=UPI00247A0129|nr:uncharacterized protein LOC129755051 [Uranotaenia lowii]
MATNRNAGRSPGKQSNTSSDMSSSLDSSDESFDGFDRSINKDESKVSLNSQQNDTEKSYETIVDDSTKLRQQNVEPREAGILDYIKSKLQSWEWKETLWPYIRDFVPKTWFQGLWCIVGVASLVGAYLFLYGKEQCDNFMSLQPKYPSVDPMLWATLNVSFARAFNREPGEPSSIVLLYDNTDTTVPVATNYLLKDIVSSNCFKDRKPVALTKTEFSDKKFVDDYREFIHRYREDIRNQGVVIVQDLHQIPAKTAPALFPFCDVYSPAVRKAMYFFTIGVAAENVTKEEPVVIAERILKQNWKQELNTNKLDPLLARLLENVFWIRSK